LHPHSDSLVDVGSGSSDSAMHRQPTAEHVVPAGSQSVTRTDQAVYGIGGHLSNWTRPMGWVDAQGRHLHPPQPADHERDAGEVQHPVQHVRRTGAELDQVA
jgi:hypothetical protein